MSSLFDTHCGPSFLELNGICDVASNICQTLALG